MFYISVLAIFKNETMNLKVWLEHYLWQGIKHFYLIDNGSDDNPLDILQDYIDKGIVTYFYLPEKFKQVEHYRFVFDSANLKNKTRWLIVCDLDEFFYGVDQQLIKKILSLDSYYDYILCNWQMFGSDGLKEHPNDIRTAITHCAKNLWTETKYIFKTCVIKNSSYIGIHNLLNIPTINNNRIRIANKLIRLNHYPIQSLAFFQKVKMTRGACDTKDSENIRDMNYFNRYDFNDMNDETLKNLVLNPSINY